MNTINDLVNNTREKIDELHSIVDVIFANYKIAADIIDSTQDRRKQPLEQLQELNKQVADLVDLSPVKHVEKVWQTAVNSINKIVATNAGKSQHKSL